MIFLVALIWLTVSISLALLYVSLQPDAAIYGTFSRVGNLGFLIFFNPAIHDLVQDGYETIIKKTARPFVVRWWTKDYLILPPKYLPDIRGVDWHSLSFFTNISDAFFLHTTVGALYKSDRMVQVVKSGINPQLPHLTTSLLPAEADVAIERELGQIEEWKSFATTNLTTAVAHRVAVALMICPEKAHDEDFVRRSSDFVDSIFSTALTIVKLPLGPFRNLLAYPLSLLHKIRLEQATHLLQPLVEYRVAEQKFGVGNYRHEDAVDWTLIYANSGSVEDTPRLITQELLHGLWAGSAAPGGLVANMVFQCLLMPEYLRALREEAETALDLHGWTEPLYSALRLQDSFIREVNRLYPTGSVTCSRTVQGRPFVFSDGLTLPVGTRLGFPIKAMQCDPELFTQPHIFDGFRFAKMEEANREGRRWAASTADMTNLAFGYGNHVCPGRFLAVRIVKIIFTKLILKYDLRWDGIPDGRPPPVFIEGQFAPNKEQRIVLKTRDSQISKEKCDV